MTQLRLRRGVLVGGAALLLVTAVAAARRDVPAPAQDKDALREVLAGFDRVQDGIRTLSAEFTETTSNPLLKEPLHAKGRFFLTKPNSVLWEYTEPEVMRFVIDKDQYVGYFPERKKAEKRDVHRWSEQIFRFFGLGQGSAELGRFYEIRLGDPGPGVKDSDLLVLVPRKRRVRKHVEEVAFWVSATTFLPTRIQYTGKDGFTRLIEFRDVRVNPDLSATLYKVEIPSDVTITSGFSGLGATRSGGGASSPDR